MSTSGYNYRDALLEIKGQIGIIKVLSTDQVVFSEPYAYCPFSTYHNPPLQHLPLSPVSEVQAKLLFSSSTVLTR